MLCIEHIYNIYANLYIVKWKRSRKFPILRMTSTCHTIYTYALFLKLHNFSILILKSVASKCKSCYAGVNTNVIIWNRDFLEILRWTEEQIFISLNSFISKCIVPANTCSEKEKQNKILNAWRTNPCKLWMDQTFIRSFL